jgi:hypothetical protein
MDLTDRISKTRYDFVPLDKIIPLKTALNIFDREYRKAGSNYFDRKFQRLREIYFSLFVCRALDFIEEKEHFLVFPARQDSNDVSIIALDSPEKGNMQYYDVKEYLNKKESVSEFIDHVLVKSQFANYNLIVGFHLNVRLELDLSVIRKSIFLVSNIDEKNEDKYKGLVRLINAGGCIFDRQIDLTDLVDLVAPDVIYHDRLKFN